MTNRSDFRYIKLTAGVITMRGVLPKHVDFTLLGYHGTGPIVAG